MKTQHRPIQTIKPPSGSVSSRIFWGLGFCLGIGLVLYLTWSVISVLVASGVLAYLANPIVTRLEKHRISRSMGAWLLGTLVVGVVVLAVTILIPIFVNQIQELSANLTPYINQLQGRIGPLKLELESRYGVVLPVDLQDLAQHVPQYLQKLSPDVRSTLSEFLQQLATGGVGFVLQVLQISLIAPFTWYLLVDWPHLLDVTRSLVPPRWRPVVEDAACEIDERIGAFIRGQLLVCAVLGLLYTGGLLLTGIDLAVTIGMMSGALFIIPYLGTLVGIVLSCLLALLKFGFDWHVIACAATFAIVQSIEGTFLTPYLVGDRVGLHPMVVIVALMVGADLLGIWGLLVAVPVTAALAVISNRLLKRYQASHLYQGF
jgi:predicted PurR-regulated permease PerM